MDHHVAALCDALREIDEGRAVSPTWLEARHPNGGSAVAEALLLESLISTAAGVPERIGSFRVLRELGRGGMGVVYLAEAEQPGPGIAAGERVAVKVLHARLAARPDAVQAILREAALGRQVRDPHVVPVLDAGTCTVAGRPSVFLAMELVEGPSLSGRLREQGPIPGPLCVSIARDVVRALAALHERGVVHRDVKPSNILLAPSGRARLADLGVSMLRSELACVTDRPMFAGTLPYAAPEQIAGVEVDGRADLFALGVTLHEMATGVACEGVRGVSLRGRGHSGFLEELVKKLLAPRREGRFESAASLQEALLGGENSRWWIRRAAAIRAGGGAAVPRRRHGPRLRGRDDEIARLLNAFEAAKEGDGRAVLVSGEAGIGKSRLLDDFLAEAARRDEAFRLWRCAFPPVRDPRAALPLERSARDLLASAELPAGAGMSAAAYLTMVESLTADLPLVVLFDDLHFAAEDERAVVAAMVAAARGRNLLVVAASREPVPPGLPEGMARVALGRLPQDVAEQIVSEAVRRRVSPDLVSRIAARSGGNPFFAVSLASVAGTSAEAPAPGARTRLPVAIRRLVSQRLSRLTKVDREILEVSACYGHRVEPAVVARALSVAPAAAARRLATIAERHSLLRRDGDGYVFDHHLVLEVLVREIPARRRRQWCAALGAALEAASGAAPPGDGATALCRLYLDAGRPADASRHLDGALAALAAGRAHAAAAELCERALRVPGLLAGPRRLDLLLRAATHRNALGQDDKVRPLLDEALRDAVARGDGPGRARVLLQSAERLVATGLNEQALALLKEAEGAGGEARTDLVAAHALLALGRQDEARARFERAIERSRASGDLGIEARATVGLSAVHVHRARLEEAGRGYEAALRLCRESRDLEGEAQALFGLGNVLFSADDYVGAQRLAREQLELQRRLGDRRGEGRVHGRLGCCLAKLGDATGARLAFERAQELAEETGDLESQAVMANHLGYAWALEGRLANALGAQQRSLAASRRLGHAQRQAVALYSAGVLYMELGMVGPARESLEASVAILREHGIRIGEAYALLALAETYALESSDDAVLRRIEEALAIRREAGMDAKAGEFLFAMGRVLFRRGEMDRARTYLEAAAAEPTDPSVSLLVAGYSSLLPGADAKSAVGRVLELLPHAALKTRMAGRFLVWRATGEIGHLAESYRLLLHLRQHAPKEAREGMIRSMPLHAAIAAAWARGGPPSGPHPYG